MHQQAWDFLLSQKPFVNPRSVIDIGGRNNNGTPRDIWNQSEYTAVDVLEAPDVDIVADASTWTPERTWSMGLCTEVFEHVEPEKHEPILRNLRLAVEPGGRLLLTCATDPRPRHAAAGGWEMDPNEFYGNVIPEDLRSAFERAGWLVEELIVNPNPGDIYVRALNPG